MQVKDLLNSLINEPQFPPPPQFIPCGESNYMLLLNWVMVWQGWSGWNNAWWEAIAQHSPLLFVCTLLSPHSPLLSPALITFTDSTIICGSVDPISRFDILHVWPPTVCYLLAVICQDEVGQINLWRRLLLQDCSRKTKQTAGYENLNNHQQI